MSLKCIKIWLLCAIGIFSAVTYGNDFSGLGGQQLRDAVKRQATPAALPQSLSEVWQYLRKTEVDADGSIMNAWSSVSPEDASDIPDGFDILDIAPVEWWSVDGFEYVGPVNDLYNLIIAPSDVVYKRGNRLPGNLGQVIADYQFWQTGIGRLGSHDVAMYAPPEKLRGDIARVIMYLAVVYPSDLHSNNGYMVFGDGDMPGLSARMYNILREWNVADPPDAYEYSREKTFSQMQGNINPFVRFPDLGEYIWGDKAGDPFESEIVPSDPDDDVDIRKYPLKGRYVRSEDFYLCFYSGYVPADAVWYVDGIEIAKETKWIELSELTNGLHEITFTCRDTAKTGKVIIEIVQ